MSRKNKKIDVVGGFVWIDWNFVSSSVWQLLSHCEKSILVELRKEWQKQTHNEYSKIFSCPLDSLGCSPSKACKIIKRFEKFKLIEIVKHGGLYKNLSLYKWLKEHWKKYQPTQEERKKIDKINMNKKSRRTANQTRRLQIIKDYNEKIESQLLCE